MAVCDKWVVLKVFEFLGCVACLVAKRISDDDEARLGLLFQKFSREWSLLRSVTWDQLGSAFGDAVYGGYTIITFGLLIGRIFQEIPKGRRLLEGVILGLGILFFLVLGGLELASIDSIPRNLIVNAAVIGTLSLVVALLFLIDLMGPRPGSTDHHSQTDIINNQTQKNTSKQTNPSTIQQPVKTVHANGVIPNEKKDDEIKDKLKDETILFERPRHGYTKFDDSTWEKDEIEKSKFGSNRNGNGFDNGNYVRLSDPLAEPDRLHYERELAKFNENYLRKYLDSVDGKVDIVKEEYLPEPQTPYFSKVKNGRLRSLNDEMSPNYGSRRSGKSPQKRIVSTPTLQQLEDYLRGGVKTRPREATPVSPGLYPMEPIEERRDSLGGRASGTPTDPGYVQYTADRWHEKKDLRTPRHSPTE